MVYREYRIALFGTLGSIQFGTGLFISEFEVQESHMSYEGWERDHTAIYGGYRGTYSGICYIFSRVGAPQLCPNNLMTEETIREEEMKENSKSWP